MSQTYNPKKRKRAKMHGFLSRAKTAGGKKTLLRRRRKGRKLISTVKQKASIKRK
jgi:large subunit ribosomal protein L34